MKRSGARIIIECLREQGVDTVFGYPGGTILNVYDELGKCRRKIRHILTCHEQGAAHAADGYARATGRVGVCFATSGPGATNLTTGIATAYMDSSPVVFITCNVSEPMIGKDSFQEVDITGITMPITKNTYLVKDVKELADVIREAFAIAAAGRPGPVLIDVVKNVTQEKAEYTFLPKSEHARHGSLALLQGRSSLDETGWQPDGADIARLSRMIAASQRPLLICGGGVVLSRAGAELLEFATRLDAPVASTVMGGGGFPGRNPLSTGMIGMHGTQASNMACDNCDLLIAVGCRFSDRVALNPLSFARQARIVQIDIDRAEIDKNVRTDHHIIGDAKQVLALLNQHIGRYSHPEWKEHVFSFKTETVYDEGGDTLTPKQISTVIAALAPADTIVTTDVGQHQMWAIQHFRFDYPGQLITSGGFGAMGFGLGAAIGAKLGNPHKTVFHITGDGSFRMNCNELATAQYYGAPIITFIYNNQSLGMVRQLQEVFCKGRHYAVDLRRGPDFVRLAQAYGLPGQRVTNSAQLEATLKKALKAKTGYVIDCAIDTEELVRPMVSNGSHITQFLLDQ